MIGIANVPSVDKAGGDRCVAFCDENGKLTGLPMNMPATKLWDNAMRKAVGCGASPDFLVGDIAVVFGDEAFMEAL